jgi:hypothetical protein
MELLGRAGRFLPVLALAACASVVVSAFGASEEIAVARAFQARALRNGVTLAIANRTNATPSIAADGNIVVVAWGASASGAGTDVYAAVSRDGGRSFGSPVRVNDVDGDARLNGEQPPRVVVRSVDGLPHVTIVWTTKGTSGTKLVHARSTDGGKTFARAAAVPGADAAGNRGWQNAVADRSGRIYTVWLDHRELADGGMASSHHDHNAARPDGVAMAQKSKLFVASLDGSIAPRSVTGGVCYCCKTALAAGADGTLYAAWRHVYPGNIRDIAFTVSRDAGRTFAAPLRVSEDRWVLEGCPDDGPAMTVDAKNRVHIVWPTLIQAPASEPTIALFYATSSDGRRFTARERIPTEGMPHHPQIAFAPDGSLAIAWDEGEKGTRRAAIARGNVDTRGRARFVRTLVGERAVYPAVAAVPDATLLAWTSTGAADGSVIRVERR